MHQDRRRLAQTCPKFDHPLEQACISNKNEKRNCQNHHFLTLVGPHFSWYIILFIVLYTIGARLCQSSAILLHSWGISFSILAHFTRCWGSLEPSRGCKLAPVGGQNWCTFVPIFGDRGAFLGHILFHVGTFRPMLGLSWAFSWRYVGSDWGPWGLDQGYVEGFVAVMSLVLRPLGCFFSAVWLRHVVFFVARVKHCKNIEKMRSDKCKKSGFDSFLGRVCCFVLWKLAPVGGQIRGTFVPIFGDLGAFLGHIILFRIGALQRMLGLSCGFSWRYVGSDWGRGV